MRISRHLMFMRIAETVALRSTCFRRAVGAIVVANNNVVSIGYNGALPGEPHCTGKTCPMDNVCTRAVHAERNVIARLPPWAKMRSDDIALYVTESPCLSCAQLIINESFIKEVFYLHEYRIRTGIDILVEAGVKMYRMTPSGYVIDYTTGELKEAI